MPIEDTEALQRRVRQYVMTPERSRERLLEVRQMIDDLLVCTDDASRLAIYNRFQDLFTRGHGSPDCLPCWSKNANDPSLKEVCWGYFVGSPEDDENCRRAYNVRELSDGSIVYRDRDGSDGRAHAGAWFKAGC